VTRRALAVLVCVGIALLAIEGRSETPDDPNACEYGVTSLLEELRAHQLEHDRRARELDDREHHVEDLERAANERLAELEEMADTVEKRIAAWERSNGDAVRQLAKIYSSMPPHRAAPLLEQLDVELATQIVAKMKHKESASVLSLLSQERALAMSRNVAKPLGMEPAEVKGR